MALTCRYVARWMGAAQRESSPFTRKRASSSLAESHGASCLKFARPVCLSWGREYRARVSGAAPRPSVSCAARRVPFQRVFRKFAVPSLLAGITGQRIDPETH